MKDIITSGKTALGIELGSTRVKAVLIDENSNVLASGAHDWENKLQDGYWTYSLEDVSFAVHSCFKKLKENVKEKFGCDFNTTGAVGVSAMMHGYLAFDKDYNLLTPFRTWRNTTTAEAARILTEKLDFNIPQRWTCSHIYQAILNGEEHVKNIAHVTTLAGYVHYMLTGVNAVGVGEASGIFPIDSSKNNYDEKMMGIYDELLKEKGFNKSLKEILPEVLTAGDNAGNLTLKGVKFLDESEEFSAGVPFAPCEGDAGTGMTATNSVKVRTGNISAGTSIFAMVVLEKGLSKVYEQIDMVTTPSGKPVAMVHCNNCTSDINAWAGIFTEFAEALGAKTSKGKILDLMFEKAMDGDSDCGGLLSYNYFSGEPVTGLQEGRPLFVRTADAKFTLGNFMRVQLYSALAALKVGLDLLLKNEKAAIDKIYGHGGFYIYPGVGQKITAAAIDAPVSVMKTAGEGGPYGMALLALYSVKGEGMTLEEFLEEKVFNGAETVTVEPDEKDVQGFNSFLENYVKGLECEKAAVEFIN